MNAFIGLLSKLLTIGFVEYVFILNNESCDMDSFSSSITLSFAKNIQKGVFDIKDGEINILSKKVVYLPIMNLKRGFLRDRLDIAFLLDEMKINEEDFLYIDELKTFEGKFNLILVDFNFLNSDLSMFNENVIEIYDHHVETPETLKLTKLQKKSIIYPIASAQTLVLLEYFITNNNLLKLFKDQNCDILIAALLLDSHNFDETLFGVRYNAIDVFVYNTIISNKHLTFTEKLFKKLKNAKSDTQENLKLGLPKILDKDRKRFEYDSFISDWSSIQINFDDLIDFYSETEFIKETVKRAESANAIMTLSHYLDAKMFTITTHVINLHIIEQVLIYLKDELKENFLAANEISQENKEFKVFFLNLRNVSRKTLEPVIKNYFFKNK